MESRQSYLLSVDGLYSTVDLFAARLSVKLPTYYSWRLDPGATAVNALCQPFCMIGKCLAKITSEKPPLDNPQSSPLEITSLVPSHLANIGGDTATTPRSEEKTNRLTGE